MSVLGYEAKALCCKLKPKVLMLIWWNLSTILSSLLSTLHEWLIYLTWLILVSGLAPAPSSRHSSWSRPSQVSASCHAFLCRWRLNHGSGILASGEQVTGPRLWYNWNWKSWPAWLEVAIMLGGHVNYYVNHNQTSNNKLKQAAWWSWIQCLCTV